MSERREAMRRLLRWTPVAVALLVAGYFGIGLFVASRMTAPSRAPVEATPAGVGLEYRDVNLKSTDGVELSGWWVPKEDATRAAILVHGWGGDKSDEHILATAPIYAEAGYSVLMIDLRAHGSSGGERRTLGYREARDVRGALAWLEDRGFEAEEVVLHGWSMGGATVVGAAPGTGVAAVVEEAGYADLPLIISEELPENSGLPSFFGPGVMLSSRPFLGIDAWEVRPEEAAAELSDEGVPLFVIHSTADEVVSFEHAQLFLEAYPDAAFWKLEGYAHVGAYTHPEYRKRLLSFLQNSVSGPVAEAP